MSQLCLRGAVHRGFPRRIALQYAESYAGTYTVCHRGDEAMSHDRDEHTNPGIASGIGAGDGFDDHEQGEGTEEVTQVDHPERHTPAHSDTGTPADFDDAVLSEIAVPSDASS